MLTASPTLALGKVETSRGRAVIPAPASSEGAGIQEIKAGSPYLQGDFLVFSILFFLGTGTVKSSTG